MNRGKINEKIRKNNKPFIHQFKPPKNLYVYDVNRNSILNVNKYTYDFLLNNKPLTVNDEQIQCDKLREFDLIKESIIYAKDKFKGKEVSFNITTNATLLTKEIISFLEQT